MGKVAVVGSLNIDLVVKVARLPRLGETLSGADFNIFVGGKGNNQAIAAKRAGAAVGLIGCVGTDAYADLLLTQLQKDEIALDFIFREPSVSTGTAHIFVTKQGENSIVVVAGANGQLAPEKLVLAESILKQTDILLLQMEIPLAVNEKAAEIAHNNGAKVIFNCAPVPKNPNVLQKILKVTDILVLNAIEAQIFGFDGANWEVLLQIGVPTVVVTLGAEGAKLIQKETIETVPAFVVEVADTTAAGDAFFGALAAELARGAILKEAVRFGCAAGALAVTKNGAEPSLPYREQIVELTKNWLA
jgi:ribokinase